MGSMITLGIGKLEIDWGKNEIFNDHSQLFLKSDVKKIPYYYANNHIEMQEGLSSKLEDVSQRLDLLGYSEHNLEKLYNNHLAEIPEYYEKPEIKFNELKQLLTHISIDKIPLDVEEPADYDLGEYVSQFIFRTPEIKAFLPPGLNLLTRPQ